MASKSTPNTSDEDVIELMFEVAGKGEIDKGAGEKIKKQLEDMMDNLYKKTDIFKLKFEIDKKSFEAQLKKLAKTTVNLNSFANGKSGNNGAGGEEAEGQEEVNNAYKQGEKIIKDYFSLQQRNYKNQRNGVTISKTLADAYKQASEEYAKWYEGFKEGGDLEEDERAKLQALIDTQEREYKILQEKGADQQAQKYNRLADSYEKNRAKLAGLLDQRKGLRNLNKETREWFDRMWEIANTPWKFPTLKDALVSIQEYCDRGGESLQGLKAEITELFNEGLTEEGLANFEGKHKGALDTGAIKDELVKTANKTSSSAYFAEVGAMTPLITAQRNYNSSVQDGIDLVRQLADMNIADSSYYESIKRYSLDLIQTDERVANMFGELDQVMADPHPTMESVQTVLDKYGDVFTEETQRVSELFEKIETEAANGGLGESVQELREEFSDLAGNSQISAFFDELELLEKTNTLGGDQIDYTVSKYQTFWETMNRVKDSLIELRYVANGFTENNDIFNYPNRRVFSLREYDELETYLLKIGGDQDKVKEKLVEFKKLIGERIDSDVFQKVIAETEEVFSGEQRTTDALKILNGDLNNILGAINNFDFSNVNFDAETLRQRFIEDLAEANPGDIRMVINKYRDDFDTIGFGTNEACKQMFDSIVDTASLGRDAVFKVISKNADLRADNKALDDFFKQLESASEKEYAAIISKFNRDIESGAIEITGGSQASAYSSVMKEFMNGTNLGAENRIFTYADFDEFTSMCEKAGIKSKELNQLIMQLYRQIGEKVNSDGFQEVTEAITRTITEGQNLTGVFKDIFAIMGGEANVEAAAMFDSMKEETQEAADTIRGMDQLILVNTQKLTALQKRRSNISTSSSGAAPQRRALDAEIKAQWTEINSLKAEREALYNTYFGDNTGFNFDYTFDSEMISKLEAALSSQGFKMAEALNPALANFSQEIYDALSVDSPDMAKISGIIVKYRDECKDLGLIVQDDVVNPLKSLEHLGIGSSAEIFSMRDFDWIKEKCGDAGDAADMLKGKFDELYAKIGEPLSSANIDAYVKELESELGNPERVQSFFDELSSNPQMLTDSASRKKLLESAENGGYGDLIANNPMISKMYGEILDAVEDQADESQLNALIDKYRVYFDKLGTLRDNLQSLQDYDATANTENYNQALLFNVDDYAKVEEAINKLGLSEEESKKILADFQAQIDKPLATKEFRALATELEGLYKDTEQYEDLYQKLKDFIKQPFDIKTFEGLKEEFSTLITLDPKIQGMFERLESKLRAPIPAETFDDIVEKLKSAGTDFTGFENQIDKLKQAFVNGEIDYSSLDKMDEMLQSFGIEAEEATKIAAMFREEMSKSVDLTPMEEAVKYMKDTNVQASQVMAELSAETDTFFNKIKNAFGTNLVQKMSSMVMMTLTKSVKQIYTNVKELESSLAQLQIVTKNTMVTTQEFADSIAQSAYKTATSVTSLVDSVTTYARLGYSIGEATKLAELTAEYSKVANVEVDEATTNITGIVKAFDVSINDLERVLDEMITVGNNFAISSAELGEGLNNCAAALVANGNTLEQALGILAAANTTIQDVSRASTAVRTVAARISNSTSELEELGEDVTDIESTAALAEDMKAFGVEIVNANGELLSTYDILDQVAAKWDSYSNTAQASIAKLLAGTRQQAVFYSIIQNWDDAKEAVEACGDAGGELADAYGIYTDTIEAKLNQLSAQWESFSANILQSEVVKFLIDAVQGILAGLNAMTSTIKNTGMVWVTIAALVANSIIKHRTEAKKAAAAQNELNQSIDNGSKKSKGFLGFMGSWVNALKKTSTTTQTTARLIGFYDREVENVSGTTDKAAQSANSAAASTANAGTSLLVTVEMLVSFVSMISELAGATEETTGIITAAVLAVGITICAVIIAIDTAAKASAIVALIAMIVMLLVEVINLCLNWETKAQKAFKAMKDAADTAIEELEKAKDALDDANDALDETLERLEELQEQEAKGTLSLVDQKELELLEQRYNDQLQNVQNQEDLVSAAEEAAAIDSAKLLNSYSTTEFKYKKQLGLDKDTDFYKNYIKGDNTRTIDEVMTLMLEHYDELTAAERQWLSEVFSDMETYGDTLRYYSESELNEIAEQLGEDAAAQYKEISDAYKYYRKSEDLLTVAVNDNPLLTIMNSMMGREEYSEAASLFSSLGTLAQLTGDELEAYAEKLGMTADEFSDAIDKALYDLKDNENVQQFIKYLQEDLNLLEGTGGILSDEDWDAFVQTITEYLGGSIETTNYTQSMSSMLSETTDAFNALNTALQDIEETGVLSSDSIQDLFENYRDLMDYFEFDEDNQGYVLKDAENYVDSFAVLGDYAAKYIADYYNVRDEMEAELNEALENALQWDSEENPEEWAEAVKALEEAQENYDAAVTNVNRAEASMATLLRSEALDQLTDALNDQIDALNDQLDAYQDLIDIRKELLQSYKEEIDYQKELATKTTNVADLETQLAIAKLDNSAAGQARQRELQSQLDSAQEELDDYTLENAVDRITNQLDKEGDEFEKVINKQTDELEDKIDDVANNLKITFNMTYEDIYDDDGNYVESKWTGGEAITTYHMGGFVGGALKDNEEFAKLLKGEFVATPSMMQNFMDNTLPTIAQTAAEGAKSCAPVFESPLIVMNCDTITSEALPDMQKFIKQAADEVKKQIDSGFSRAGRNTRSLNLSL